MAEVLINYGVAGMFILYLVYDRQVILKSFQKSMDRLTEAINKLKWELPHNAVHTA